MNDEFQLSKELLDVIAPGHGDNVQIKFDAKGTLHVLDRDSEGALLRDYPVLDTGDKEVDIYDELDRARLKELKSKNKNKRFMFKLVIFEAVILCICSFLIVKGVGDLRYLLIMLSAEIFIVIHLFYVIARCVYEFGRTP